MSRLRFFRPYRILVVAGTAIPIFLRYALLLRRKARGKVAAERWAATHEFAARRIERMALHLGGIFIKLAQVLGARRDVFPEPFIRILSKFHDEVPARPLSALQGVLAADMRQPIADIYAQIDDTPLAAASLAQVHRAKLRDGRDVVVKVQYPEARRLFPTDIKSARFVARLVQRLPIHIDFVSIVDEIAKFIALELDFRREVTATKRVAAAFAGADYVRIPEIVDEFCGDRTIVMGFLDGIQVTEVEALRAAGHDLTAVAEKIARIYVEMIFRHGFFHGDPHPGNLLVLKDGRIGLLDFGLSKELPPAFAKGVAQFLLGAFSGNIAAAMAAATSIGFEFGDVKPEAVRELVFKLLGQGEGGNVLAVLEQSPITKIPEDFPLIVRAFILLNGVSFALAPGQRSVQRAMLQQLGTIQN